MTMQRWDPFADFRRVDEAFSRFFGGAPRGGVVAQSAGRWDFPMDVIQEGDDLIVQASLPGVSPDEIGVTIEDGLLTIEGASASETEKREGEYLLRERRSGRFHRALRLPNSVDADKASPTYANGVLTISLPKREEKKARRLEIKSG